MKFPKKSLASDAAQKQSAVKNDDARQLEIRALLPTMKYEGCSEVETLAGVISNMPITKLTHAFFYTRNPDIDDDMKN